MDRTRPEFVEFGEMEFSTVPFVLTETVFRKTYAEVTHHCVTRDLRNHAGRGNCQADAIPVDNGSLRKGKWNNRKTIDKNVFGRTDESLDGCSHGLVRGAEDVDSVDFDVVNHA